MFHPRHKHFEPPLIELNNTRIEFVQSVKTLGVYFAADMSWNDHINYVVQKLSRTVGIMRRNCFNFPTSVNLLLYHSLFSSIANYGCMVWATTTAGNINKLTVLQKRIIRIACKVPYFFHTAGLFHQHNIIQMKSMYNYRLCYKYKLAMMKMMTPCLDLLG